MVRLTTFLSTVYKANFNVEIQDLALANRFCASSYLPGRNTVQAAAHKRLSPFPLPSLFQVPIPCKLPANCKAPNLKQLCGKFPFDPVQDSLSLTKVESRHLSAESLLHTTQRWLSIPPRYCHGPRAAHCWELEHPGEWLLHTCPFLTQVHILLLAIARDKTLD